MFFNKLIFSLTGFPDTIALKNSLDTEENTGLFNGDTLEITVNPNEYTPTYGDETTVSRGFTTDFLRFSSHSFLGFEVEVSDNRSAIYYILRSLQLESQVDLESQKLVSVDDYVFPDALPAPTLRRGILNIQGTGGQTTHAVTGDNYIFSTRILFQEVF